MDSLHCALDQREARPGVHSLNVEGAVFQEDEALVGVVQQAMQVQGRVGNAEVQVGVFGVLHHQFAEHLVVPRPLLRKCGGDHHHDRTALLVGQRSDEADAECHERLAHADFIREDQAGLVAETLDYRLYGRKLTRPVRGGNARVREAETVDPGVRVDGPGHARHSAKVFST